MSYVVQQPHSNTNDSDMYRVVWYQEWLSYINGCRHSYSYEEFNTHEEAALAANIMNGINCQNR